MNPADFLLAYLAIGAALSAVALVRMLLSGPSMDYLLFEACRSGLPIWCAAVILLVSLLATVVEYAVLWPLRWREALR